MIRETDKSSTVDWLLLGADGQEIRLVFPPGGCLTVGRDVTSDISLRDAGVSRRHARIGLEGGSLWVEDLQSQNGTFVNTRPIRKAVVHEGDIVTFGRLHCTLLGRQRSEDRGPSLLRPLSTEGLERLLELARRLNAHRDPWVAFHKSLEPLARLFDAERGAILAWNPSHEKLHTVAAYPSSTFGELDIVANDPLASTVLSSGSARESHGTFPAGGGGPSIPRVMVPVFSGRRAHGIIYLARHQGSEAFSREEKDFLNAFAWLSEGAFEDLLARGPGSRNETPEVSGASASARRESAEDRRERRGSDHVRYLAHLAEGIGRARNVLRPDGLSGGRNAADLRRLQLLAEALELLERAPDEKPSPTALDVLVEEAASAYAVTGERWRLASTGPLEVNVPVTALRVVVGLVAVALVRRRDRRRSASPLLEIRAAYGDARLELRCLAGRPSRAAGETPDEVLLEIASELLASRLGGGLEPTRSGEIVVGVPTAPEHSRAQDALMRPGGA